eukprot:TRINITY_DN79466_c0_g1_i1.p1 TRINITY_DN79466_c0_g1~~TRINITY_DN79466_c0_g1_i1.p1  ORF type:complete len:879 (-),score=144.71 TRINITY_DN79466_c0_g1_i1:163-2799(-)
MVAMDTNSSLAHQTPVQLQYMWSDSGLSIFRSMTKSNPLRWSRLQLPGDFNAELSADAVRYPNRPVTVIAYTSGQHLERQFENATSATEWVQSSFGSQRAIAAANSDESWDMFAACRNDTSTGDANDEIVVEEYEAADESFEEVPNERAAAIEEPAGEVAADANDADTTPHDSTSVHDDFGLAIDGTNASVSFKYMWADARVLPLALMRQLAEKNPLRWSKSMTPDDLCTALDSEKDKTRPVILSADLPGQHVQRTFPTPALAAQWIRNRFGRQSEDTVNTNPSEAQDRLCVICLSAPREIMLMPCRHAVLCEECMGHLMARDDAKCPICRQRVNNHARGFFVDDYVEMVEALQMRLERSQAAAYEGMYNHVRPLMVTGALLASGAAAAFVLAPPAAPALAGAAFAVGYVPWFATTAAHFEREDLDTQGQIASQQFLSQEDLKSPLTLAAKLAFMGVAIPVAAVVFFLPYLVWRGVLRPVGSRLVDGLIRVLSGTHVYGARPIGRALSVAFDWLWWAMVGTANFIGDSAVFTAQSIYDYLLLPSWELGKATFSAISSAARYSADVTWQALSAVAQATYTYVIRPSANFVWSAMQAMNTYALQPLSDAVIRLATDTYVYVIVPIGSASYRVLCIAGRGLQTAASGFYTYILAPGSKAVWSGLCWSGDVLVKGATCLYAYVIVPAGSATWAGLKLLGSGAAAIARGLGYGLSVIAQGLGYGLSAVARGLTFCAEGVYGNVVLPIGRAAGAVCYAVANVAVSTGELIYSYVLVPSGRAIAAGAGAVYVYVILPTGRGIYAAGEVSAHALSAVARVGANAVVLSSNTVYVYVIQPGGAAVYAGTVAAGAGIQACGQSMRRASVSAGQSISSAYRQSVDLLNI